MSVLFRPHRGMLADAMKEVVKIQCRRQLVRHLNRIYEFGPRVKIEEIDVKPYGYDARIGWNTYIVTQNGNAIGFTDGPL